MPYKIILTRNAIEKFKRLDARLRATVRDTLNIHLSHEPTKESKSRIKRLREFRIPQYRLKADEVRIFYQVTDQEEVVILGIMPKEETIAWLEQHGEK